MPTFSRPDRAALPPLSALDATERPDFLNSAPGALDESEPDSAERDRRFVDMLRAFRTTGGLLRGEEATDLMRYHDEERGLVPASSLARLARQIASRDVISFEWHGERWLPFFQFDRHDMRLRDDVRRIAAELAPTHDGWAVALWFARPNAWLQQRAPIDVLRQEAESVWQAARAERFSRER